VGSLSQIQSRQATIKDLDDLVHLFDEYRIFYEQKSDKDGARKFLWDKFEHNESIIFIAVDGELSETIGFAQLYPSFSSVSMSRIWILNDLYVRENYRGKHIGRMLLDTAKEYAILTKAIRIELTTASTNGTAQRLYEMNGYELDKVFYKYLLNL
jgi:ribosomal protein S18 acetylase RimI-like enzyme